LPWGSEFEVSASTALHGVWSIPIQPLGILVG